MQRRPAPTAGGKTLVRAPPPLALGEPAMQAARNEQAQLYVPSITPRPPHAGADYRPDIDGLRALAVGGVILFHAGVSAVGGGFAGVDVFYVISGYLIASIIVREQRDGRLSLVRFYQRRARRILPALLFVLVPTTLAAAAWLEPKTFDDYAATLIAVLTFCSNFVFMAQTGGYFAPAAEQTPLIHTWSLAVEEQFYIVFPLAMLLAWRFGERRLRLGIVAVALASLLLAEALRDVEPTLNFYLPFTRAWDLLAGVLLALHPHPVAPRLGRPARELLAGAGVAMIVATFVAYDQRTPFPSVWRCCRPAACCSSSHSAPARRRYSGCCRHRRCCCWV